MKKLYVGNLPYSTDEAELEELFGQFGPIVDAKVIRDYETKRSKGFAFIEFETEAAANEAISNMNGKDVQGRPLKVNIAKERQGGGGGGGRGGRGGRSGGGRDGDRW